MITDFKLIQMIKDTAIYLSIRVVDIKCGTYGLHRTVVALYVLENTFVFN